MTESIQWETLSDRIFRINRIIVRGQRSEIRDQKKPKYWRNGLMEGC
jgi:hypothetical protein